MGMMEYINAFIVGGVLCICGQILLDKFKLSIIQVMSLFVVAGGLLEGIGFYDKFIDFAGAAAIVPISSIGQAFAKGVIVGLEEQGLIGIGIGMFQFVAFSISSAIVVSFVVALIFQPKG